jgi:hypothetical protein
LHGRQQQADQNCDNGDDDQTRRPGLGETACTGDDPSVTEPDGITPRKMDATGAEAARLGVRLPGYNSDKQIAVGGRENDNPIADQ